MPPLLFPEVATPETKSIEATIVRKSASQAVFSRMQPTLHATRRTPHCASCLGQPMSAWSVKTRRAPSRLCRDARVHGHTAWYRVHLPLPHCCSGIARTLVRFVRRHYWRRTRVRSSTYVRLPVCCLVWAICNTLRHQHPNTRTHIPCREREELTWAQSFGSDR